MAYHRLISPLVGDPLGSSSLVVVFKINDLRGQKQAKKRKLLLYGDNLLKRLIKWNIPSVVG